MPPVPAPPNTHPGLRVSHWPPLLGRTRRLYSLDSCAERRIGGKENRGAESEKWRKRRETEKRKKAGEKHRAVASGYLSPGLGTHCLTEPSVWEFFLQGGLCLALGASPIGRKVGSTDWAKRAVGSGQGYLNPNTLQKLTLSPQPSAAVSR